MGEYFEYELTVDGHSTMLFSDLKEVEAALSGLFYAAKVRELVRRLDFSGAVTTRSLDNNVIKIEKL